MTGLILTVTLLVLARITAVADTRTLTATQVGVCAGRDSQQTRRPPTLRNTIGMEFVLIPAGAFQRGSEDAKASNKALTGFAPKVQSEI